MVYTVSGVMSLLKFHSNSNSKNKMGFKWNVETKLVGRNSLRLNTEINEDNNKEPKTCKCRQSHTQ